MCDVARIADNSLVRLVVGVPLRQANQTVVNMNQNRPAASDPMVYAVCYVETAETSDFVHPDLKGHVVGSDD